MFDPDGPDYDIDGAMGYGFEPDEDDEWPETVQLSPRSEIIMYGMKHNMYYEVLRRLRDEGKVIVRGRDKRWYAITPYAPPVAHTATVKLRRVSSA